MSTATAKKGKDVAPEARSVATPRDPGAAWSVLEGARLYREGMAALRKRNWRLALHAFQRAVERDPDAGEYRAQLGWAHYLAHGNSPEVLAVALGHAKAATKLSPHDPTPWLLLGRLLLLADRPQRARQVFLRCLEADPRCVDAKRELRILTMRKPRKNLWARIGRTVRRR